MAQTTLYLTPPLNQSCQIGDFVYYAPTSEVSSFDVSDFTDILPVGEILSMGQALIGDPPMLAITLTCNIEDEDNFTEPQPNDFLFFVKNREVNQTHVKGYYGMMTFKNNSKDRAELFMAGCEVTPSS